MRTFLFFCFYLVATPCLWTQSAKNTDVQMQDKTLFFDSNLEIATPKGWKGQKGLMDANNIFSVEKIDQAKVKVTNRLTCTKDYNYGEIKTLAEWDEYLKKNFKNVPNSFVITKFTRIESLGTVVINGAKWLVMDGSYMSSNKLYHSRYWFTIQELKYSNGSKSIAHIELEIKKCLEADFPAQLKEAEPLINSIKFLRK
jgi:hypothetical protein